MTTKLPKNWNKVDGEDFNVNFPPLTTPKTIEEKILEEFDEKLNKYDKDGGFIVYVEGFDNTDFDTELMKDFILFSLTSLRNQIAKEDVEWLNRQSAFEEMTEWGDGYNQALKEFLSYKHNQIK